MIPEPGLTPKDALAAWELGRKDDVVRSSNGKWLGWRLAERQEIDEERLNDRSRRRGSSERVVEAWCGVHRTPDEWEPTP